MKIITILGARPQFIKAGTVSRAIREFNQNCSDTQIYEVIVHTGQHYDANMSDVFFEEMHIPKPDYYLGIGGNGHGAMTGQMLEKIESVLLEERPDWVLVYGDTNSTLAGALAASKLHIKVAHIEAGLRSFNMRMPEEINRILTDRVSTKLFCPTQTAVDNLQKEGIDNWISAEPASLVGDVMQDGAFYYDGLAVKPEDIALTKNFVLSTIHRAENTDDPLRLRQIVSALVEIASNQQVILPLHPRTKKIADQQGLDLSALTVIDPVGYLNMVWLIKNSRCVLTDSGGLQKEAFFFEKPCITMRDETEWIELVEAGVNVLVGASKSDILSAYHSLSKKSLQFDQAIYGGGVAAQTIVNHLVSRS